MINHGRVESTVRPDEVHLDESHVWVATDIAEVNRPALEENEEGFTGFEYDLKQFTKDEYILHRMDEEKTETNLALAEIATLVITGGAL